MKDNPLIYLEEIISKLETSPDYSRDFVNFRIDFHRKFCWGYIFSIRFGIDFFKETLNRLNTGELIKGNNLEIYDKNFNIWLVKVRKEMDYLRGRYEGN